MNEEQNIPEEVSEVPTDRVEVVNENTLQEQPVLANAQEAEPVVIQIPTSDANSQQENMEAHHHPPIQHQKKWKDYLFEFLMLFLAVFCGFIAENIREHVVEKNREKQYIRSIVEDLEADTLYLGERSRLTNRTINNSDSLILLLNKANKEQPANDIYYFFRFLGRSFRFNVNDKTIIQLRNAGGMRLITNRSVGDSIVAYYQAVEHIKFLHEEQLVYKKLLENTMSNILNGSDFGKVVNENNNLIRASETLKLRSTDEEIINNCILILQRIKSVTIGIRSRQNQLTESAKGIRNFILKEYQLE